MEFLVLAALLLVSYGLWGWWKHDRDVKAIKAEAARQAGVGQKEWWEPVVMEKPEVKASHSGRRIIVHEDRRSGAVVSETLASVMLPEREMTAEEVEREELELAAKRRANPGLYGHRGRNLSQEDRYQTQQGRPKASPENHAEYMGELAEQHPIGYVKRRVREVEPEPDLLDVAIGIGVGMAVDSLFSDDSPSPSSGSDGDTFTGGGGESGGGGASSEW